MVADTDSVLVRPDTVRRDSASRDTTEVARDTTDVAQDTTTKVATRFPDPDDFFKDLARKSGFHVVEYRGNDVKLDLDKESVRLDGEAQAKYASSVLDAETISYWIGLQFISARRSIKLVGDDRTVTSDAEVNYDVSGTKGTIVDARTSFSQQGTEWFVRGDATPRGASTVFVVEGDFTSCELEVPHYYFKAGKIKIVAENVLVAWPVTLYVHEVPLIWLPFFAQDIRPGRRSGFLPPRFGVNDIVSTSSNVNRSVTDFGYYFAINEFMDAQTSIDWFSGEFTRFNTSFRYKSLKKFFEGNLLASVSFGDSRTIQIRADHQQDITPVTNLRINTNFVSNTRTFERQSLNPTLQTQRISSDLGLQHRFPFASVNLSASRRQDLGTLQGSTDLTLPNLQMTFSPITLFRAPRSRSGPFNNIVVSGGTTFSRLDQTREKANDLLTTRGSANTGIRIGSFGMSGNANFNTVETTPFDSLGIGPGSFTQTRIDYGGMADYQVDLVGSTTFRPTASFSKSMFKSMDTEGRFVKAPTRLRIGATLSSDLYAFLPGFGPFQRIRHKFSPRFNYSYSPAITVSDSMLMIPGFPITNVLAENRLSVTINQTFEAKLRADVKLSEEEKALLEGREFVEDSLALAPGVSGETPVDSLGATSPDSLAAAADSTGVVAAPDSAAVAAAADSVVTDQPTRPRPVRSRPPAPQRNVVLLAINSSALNFDFAKKGEPVLVTDRWNHRINSDLLRGLSLNLSLDLFDGFGADREFSPILSSLTGAFTFSSSRGLGGLLGLGSGQNRRRDDPRDRLRSGVDSRYNLQDFNRNPDPLDPGLRGAGPWNLAVTYSLQRRRGSEGQGNQQSLGATLSLTPTPNWRLTWRTNYNVEKKEFGQHLVTLDRDLHRWMASFVFSRAPNGNFIFQMSVNLRDAPDLKFDYDKRSLSR